MDKLRYFIDTEFIEKPYTIDLISIGICCEDGREYYAISSEYNYEDCDSWLNKNVILPAYNYQVLGKKNNWTEGSNFHKVFGKSHKKIAEEIKEFVGFPDYSNGKPEFWAYYADYDWVVFCWLFGKMIDLPDGFPFYCKDLKQTLAESGKEKLADPDGEHIAIVDARWNMELYNYLVKK